MEWDAEKYAQHSIMQNRIGLMLVDLLDPQPGERILDLGCGTGNLSIKIAEKIINGEIVGIDSDINMIKEAQAITKKAGVTNFNPIIKNAAELDFSEEFDAVFSNIVIHWIKNTGILLKSINKSLNTKGRISIAALYDDIGEQAFKIDHNKLSTFIESDPKTKLRTIELEILECFVKRNYFKGILPMDEFQSYQKEVDPNLTYAVVKEENMRLLLEQAGFKEIEIIKQHFSLSFDDIDKYFDYRQANLWTFFLTYFPKKYRGELTERLINLIKKRWEEIPKTRREWPIVENWPVLFITAKKNHN